MRIDVGTLLCFCFASAAVGSPLAQNDPTLAQSATLPPPSLVTCMWSQGEDGGFAESRYVVDLARGSVDSQTVRETPAGEAPACAKLAIERSKRDAAAYRQLADRVKNRKGHADTDKRLADALEWVEKSAQWGDSPASSVAASPDGKYVVLMASGPLFLVNMATLETRVLTKPHPYLETPVAWAPDSRLLAYATPGTDKAHIYSVQQHAVIATRTATGPWPLSLSWSSDMRWLAVFGLEHRRIRKTPAGLLGAIVGHPEFLNDGVVTVYETGVERHTPIVLKRDISEMDSLHVELEWK